MIDEIHFGQFCLDFAQGALLRDGKLVPPGNRALEILLVLASAKGEIVTKDEFMARIWPGRVVEENNIQIHVSALRKVLDAALSDRPESLEMSLARLRQLDPMLRLSNLKEQMPFRRAEDLARLMDGLRKAGLPE